MRFHERTNLPVWRVCVSSCGRRPKEGNGNVDNNLQKKFKSPEDGTKRGKSCSTVHRPDKAIPDMLLVGGIEEERGGLVSRHVETISSG